MRYTLGTLIVIAGSIGLCGCETGIGDTTDTPATEAQRREFLAAQFAAETTAQFAASTPWRQSWSQYQGDPAGSGFLAVETDEIGAIRWRRMVGQVVNSSPVIGPDGTIYVGTAAGELLAIAPNGTERWRRDFFPDAVIMSTPAVAADGSIFVVYQQRDGDGKPVSTLNRVSPDGRWLWARLVGDTEGSTTASPKVLGEYVFLNANTPGPELMIFDFDANVVARRPTEQCTPVCGSAIDFGDIWNKVVSIGDVACCIPPLNITPFCLPDQLNGGACDFNGPGSAPVDVHVDPSVAVTALPALAPDGNPIVVIANGFCMSAYRFDAPALEFLWQRDIYGNGCDYKPVQHTSPAIFPNGKLVICNEKGEVEGYDPLTGDRLWSYDAGEPVRAPAAAIGSWIFVVSENFVHFIDENGEQIDAMRLTAPTRFAPAVSVSYVYAATTETVQGIDFLFDSRVVDKRIEGAACSPAFGPDGTVYVVTLDGILVAYGESNAPPGTISTGGGSTGDIAGP